MLRANGAVPDADCSFITTSAPAQNHEGGVPHTFGPFIMILRRPLVARRKQKVADRLSRRSALTRTEGRDLSLWE